MDKSKGVVTLGEEKGDSNLTLRTILHNTTIFHFSLPLSAFFLVIIH